MSGKPGNISRRDFVNGCAASLAAGATLTPAEAIARRLLQASDLPGDYYPPTRHGMRGSHAGSFEVAHQMRDGASWNALDSGERLYDLVVVGGGLSGLAAAWFYRRQHGPDAKILILDNHDDFGGHAKRNEFWHDGQMYLLNGGTLNVEAPSQYSDIAAELLSEVGIDRTRYFAQNASMWSRYSDMGLKPGIFFDKHVFGQDRLVAGYRDMPKRDYVAQVPVSDVAQQDLLRLYESKEDYLAELSIAEKQQKLTHMNYADYLRDVVKCHPDVVKLFDPMGLLVTSIDAVPAMYCKEMGYPGFDGLQLPPIADEQLSNEPGGQHGRENQERANRGDPDMYFPDGNATIARLIVRSLIPAAVPGSSMEDVVTAKVDYRLLDDAEHDVRIRLNSTVVNVRNRDDGRVDTEFVQNGNAHAVRSRNVVLACWHAVIPYICTEIPDSQKSALLYGVKAPLAYTSVLLSNWRSFVDAGVSRVTSPGSFHSSFGLPASLHLGDYQTSRSPDAPIVLRMSAYFYQQGLSRREQHRVGRSELLSTTFDTFEERIRDQLSRTFQTTKFDDEKDILGITVNRWPHGYTYSYNPLYDPEEWAYTSSPNRPAIAGRQSVGRISIANADAAASPHTDAAINEAYRAVSELLE